MGDGRHRQDPGSYGRYLVAALGILIVLILLATGGYALYSVLTAQPGQAPESAGAAPTGGDTPTQRASVVRQPPPATALSAGSAGSAESRSATLALHVTGSHSYVSVRGPDGNTLLNEVLRRGERARFHQRTLRVTVGKPAAVRIVVNGAPKDSNARWIDTFTVSRSG